MSKHFTIFLSLVVFCFLFSPPALQAADLMEDCVNHTDCNSGSCAGSNTCFCSPTLIPPGAPSKCILKYSTGTPCINDYECLSGQCTSGTCKEGGSAPGGACGKNEDCTLGACASGPCFCGARGVCEEGNSPGGGPITGTTGPVEFSSPIGQGTPSQFIGKAIKTVLGIIGAIALLIFVYGGLMWMTAAGSPERITQAKKTLAWAVLGLLVIFASYTLVDFVISNLI